MHFSLQGDEGFPGFPGPKVKRNTDFLFLKKQRISNLTTHCTIWPLCLHFDVGPLTAVLSLKQGAAGDSGTKGGPGPKGNRGQRVSFYLHFC